MDDGDGMASSNPCSFLHYLLVDVRVQSVRTTTLPMVAAAWPKLIKNGGGESKNRWERDDLGQNEGEG